MRIPSVCLTVMLVATPSMAWAVPRSPISIQEQLGLAYQPPCTICHTGGAAPYAGDVNSLFAKSMLANGLVPNDRPAMKAALAALEAAHVDSDGDGLTDIAELRIGLDPSDGAAQPPVEASSAVAKGCAVSGARPQGWVSLLALWRWRCS